MENLETAPQEAVEQSTVATEQSATQEAGTEQQQSTTEQPFLSIKYNNTDKSLTREEAIENAQKGLDYDRVRKGHDTLQEIIQQGGYADVDDFRNKFQEQKQQSQLNARQNQINELEELGYDTETANKMVEKDAELATYKEKLSVYEQKELQGKEDQKLAVEIGEFQKSFKDVDINALPTEVLLKTNAGMPLKAAYMEYAYAQVQKENDALKANNENAAATTGELGGNEPTEKEFTDEMVANMTPQELAKPENWEKAKKLYGMK